MSSEQNPNEVSGNSEAGLFIAGHGEGEGKGEESGAGVPASPEDDPYDVECILAEAQPDDELSETHYLVKWEGFPMHECTWEPEHHLGPGVQDQWNVDKSRHSPDWQQHNLDRYEEALREAGVVRDEDPEDLDELPVKKGIAIGKKSPDEGRSSASELFAWVDSDEESPTRDAVHGISDPPITLASSSSPIVQDILRQPSGSEQQSVPSRKESANLVASQAKKEAKKEAQKEVTKEAKKGQRPAQVPSKPRSSTAATSGLATIPGTSIPASAASTSARAPAFGPPIRGPVPGSYQGTARPSPLKSSKEQRTVRNPPANKPAERLPARPIAGSIERPAATNLGSGSAVPFSDLTVRRRVSQPSQPVRLTAKKSGINIFKDGKVRKPRTNLEASMGDPNKAKRMFKNAHYLRQAEKKSRDAENRAPPPSATQLFDISKGPPPKRSSKDQTTGHAQELSTALDAPARQPSRDGLFLPIVTSPSALETPADLPSAPPSEEQRRDPRPMTKRKVRFMDESEATEAGSATGIDYPDQMLVDSPAALSAEAPPQSLADRLSEGQHTGTGRVHKTVRFGASEPIEVTFDGVVEAQEPWFKDLASRESLLVEYTGSAKSISWLRPLIGTVCCAGSISAEGDGNTALQVSANHLRQGLLCLFCHHKTFSMAIWPTKCEEWTQLFGSDRPGSDSMLRFVIFHPTTQLEPFLRPAAAQKATISYSGSGTISAVVARFFGFDFLGLFSRKQLTGGRKNIMLIFPKSRAAISSLFVRWLQENDPDSRVFSAQIPGAWDAFRRGEPGAVIIHELLGTTIWKLPKLRHSVASRGDLYWFFSEPNHHQPLYPSIARYQPPLPGGLYFTQLFPHANVFLLTPSFLLTEPRAASQFLEWWLTFHARRDMYNKLVTAHNFHEFLANLAKEKRLAQFNHLSEFSKEDLNSWDYAAALAFEIHFIEQRWSAENETHGEPGTLISADPAIDASDEQSLVNWFGYWTSTQLDRFKKFWVLGSDTGTIRDRPRKATRRLQFLKYTKETLNEPNQYLEAVLQHDVSTPPVAVASGPGHALTMAQQSTTSGARPATGSMYLPNDSVFAFNHALASLAKQQTTEGRKWVLYEFPISYADFDMVDHFGDNHTTGFNRLARWFGFAWPFGAVKKWFNTYIGFFYTITDKWDKDRTPRGPAKMRHPWLAIYRPVNTNMLPWHQVELIIWDMAAHERCPHGVPREDGLLDMQQRLIDYVRQHTEEKNPGMPLKRVWLGGFSLPPCESSFPIDITFAFLGAMLAKLPDVLPAQEHQLIKSNFKQVQLRSDPGYEPQISRADLLDQPMDLDTSDDELKEDDQDDEEDVRMIFHPPRGTRHKLNAISQCNNLLHEAQRLAKQRDPAATYMDFTYPATEVWYAKNKTEGRVYEHVFVGSFKEAFTKCNIDQGGGSNNSPLGSRSD